MSSSKRFQRESIGVMPSNKGFKTTTSAPTPPGSTTFTPVETQPAATTLPPPRNTTGIRETVASQSTEDALLGPIEMLIDRLPFGSINFADQIAQQLWARPSPAETRALAAIAEFKAQTPVSSRRFAIRSVAVRQRVQKLLFTPLTRVDADRLVAMGVEWARLAKLTGELRRNWPIGPGGSVEERVLNAAFELLPDVIDLETEAALNSEMARLAEAMRDGGSWRNTQWNVPLHELEQLVHAVQSGTLTPDQGLCLELFAGCVLADRHASEGSRTALERDRRMLELLSDLLETRVDVQLATHQRDQATATRLTIWRRCLTAARTRVHEALTRPAQAQQRVELETTGPVSAEAPVDTTGSVAAQDRTVEREPTAPHTGAIDPPATGPVESGDDRIVDHLRSLRAQLEPTAPYPLASAPPPRKSVSRRTWIVAAGVLALFMTALFTMPSLIEPTPPVRPAQFQAALAVTHVARAGTLLIVTVDPEWDSMTEHDRQADTTRLMGLAETAGCTAGVVVAADGEVLATWSPGVAPTIRRSSGTVVSR
jgi:hypothetical protein